MKNKITVIKHPSQLNSLTAFTFIRKRGMRNIRLSPEFKHPEKQQLERDLNKYYYSCGCDTGAKGLIVFLVIGTAFSIAGSIISQAKLGKPFIVIGAFTLIGAILGKLMGLLYANRRLRKTIYTIQAYWKIESEQAKEIILCR